MSGERYLSILDVGHGSCAVINAGDAGVIVIDTGRRTGLLEFLNQQRVSSVRTVYLSHADEDHVAALVGLLESNTVTVDRVVVNSDASKGSKVWDDLVYELDRKHRQGAVQLCVGLVAGQCERLDDVEVEVLGPSRYLTLRGVGNTDRSKRRIKTNSISAVIRVRVAGQGTAIIPGDLDPVGLDDLIERVGDVRAAVLVFPHHGLQAGHADVQTFAESLLKATAPAVVVFSFGRARYRAPCPEAVRAVKQLLPKSRVICTQLSEHCSRTTAASSFSHLDDAFAQGRAAGMCCGGTIVVPLDGSAVEGVRPSYEDHREYIASCVETPLCVANS